MVDKRIMARELIARYPDNTFFHSFVQGLLEFPNDFPLRQLYGDICVRETGLIETVEQLREVPEQMGWNKPNHCRPRVDRAGFEFRPRSAL